jgi:hypothetical protein
MFNRSGYAREAALKSIKQLPDSSFFLAALVWRLNDWVEPVRRAATECANRELPRLSVGTIVGAAPFLLERMPYWRRWSSPPAIVLDTLARPDCLDVVGKFATTVEISARAALRFARCRHNGDPQFWAGSHPSPTAIGSHRRDQGV